jgi:hypothetical protein
MSIDVPSVRDLVSSLVTSVRATVRAQHERDELKAEVIRLMNQVQHLEDVNARLQGSIFWEAPASQGCEAAATEGWYCSREPGHDGPCALWVKA